MRTLTSCNLDGTEPRTSAWRRAEIPAAGGIGNARSVGRVHSALACHGSVDGVRLLSPEGVDVILEEQTNGPDHVFGMPMRFGMGFGLNSETLPISPNPRSFFWGGWGGSSSPRFSKNKSLNFFVISWPVIGNDSKKYFMNIAEFFNK